jgi:hypothetical protein
MGKKERDNDMVEFDVERIRRDFPVLSTSVNNNPLVFG